jgi:hypothetical protein
MPATFHCANNFSTKASNQFARKHKEVSSSFFHGASARFQAMASPLPGF